MDEAHQLLLEIERKDRRFRTAQSVFMALLTVALGVVIYVGLATIQRLDEQGKQSDAGLTTLQKENLKLQQLNIDLQHQTQGYIKCVALFFARPDRQDSVITDLDKCEISNTDGQTSSNSFATPPANNNTPVTSAPPSSQNANNAPPPQQGNGQQPGNGNPPAAAPPDPPIDILGIPVCVPFTNLCVRR